MNASLFVPSLRDWSFPPPTQLKRWAKLFCASGAGVGVGEVLLLRLDSVAEEAFLLRLDSGVGEGLFFFGTRPSRPAYAEVFRRSYWVA
jgi:hypothetical protein